MGKILPGLLNYHLVWVYHDGCHAKLVTLSLDMLALTAYNIFKRLNMNKAKNKLQVTGYRLQVTGYRLQVTGCGLQ
jgi:hypothetical protein